VALTEQQIAKLKDENPGRELVLLSSRSGAEIVARIPGLVEMAELRNRIGDKVKSGGAMEWLVRSCVVHPPREELNALLARKPVLIEKMYQKLEAEAGGAEELEISKL
jgi:hypothetical protein